MLKSNIYILKLSCKSHFHDIYFPSFLKRCIWKTSLKKKYIAESWDTFCKVAKYKVVWIVQHYLIPNISPVSLKCNFWYWRSDGVLLLLGERWEVRGERVIISRVQQSNRAESPLTIHLRLSPSLHSHDGLSQINTEIFQIFISPQFRYSQIHSQWSWMMSGLNFGLSIPWAELWEL